MNCGRWTAFRFEVARGELFGFLGPNGAGKTTTISMMSGLLRPDEGTVTIGEYNLWESPTAAKRLLGWCRRTWRFMRSSAQEKTSCFLGWPVRRRAIGTEGEQSMTFWHGWAWPNGPGNPSRAFRAE